MVLKQEVKEEIANIENMICLMEESKEEIAKKVRQVTNSENLSQVILFKFAEIQKQIEILNSQNNYYDNKMILENEKKGADTRRVM